MKMYINAQWIDKAETIPVFNPFDQSLLDTVPGGTSADVELAITSAVRGAVLDALDQRGDDAHLRIAGHVVDEASPVVYPYPSSVPSLVMV